MDAGERPIRDFIAYPPGRYLLFWFSTHIGGMQVRSPRTIMALFTGLAAAGIGLIGRRAGLKKSAVIPVLCYLLMPMYYYYRFFTIMLVCMILSLDLQLRNKSMTQLVFSGLLAATVIWFRLFLGIFIMIMLPLAALAARRPPAGYSRARRIIPSLIMYIGFLLQILYIGGFGVWFRYLQTCRSFSQAGFSDMSLPWPPLWSPAYLSSLNVSYFFQDSMIYIGLIILILFSADLIIGRKWRDSTTSALCCVGWIGFGLVWWRTGYGNLLRAFPPLAIMSVCLFQRAGRRKPLITAVGGFLLVGLLVDSLLLDPQTYQSVGIVRTSNSRFCHPRFDIRMNNSDCFIMSQIVSALEAAADGPSTRLLVLPFHTIFNFITGYSTPSYFDWVLPGNFSNPDLYREMVNEVTGSSPDLVLLNDEPFDGYFDRRFSFQYPELMLWLMRDYYRWYQVGGFKILRRKPSDAESLIAEDNRKLLMVTGETDVGRVYIGEKPVRTLIQKGDARYVVAFEQMDEAILASGVLLDTSGGSGGICEVSIYVNGDMLGSGQLKPGDT
ncbi:MAG TPA: hypothetical protein PLV45_04940, partial [bacterium]|nr:hypothetical protein [bacterium]